MKYFKTRSKHCVNKFLSALNCIAKYRLIKAILIITLFFNSCNVGNNYSSEYFTGTVIIRAEQNYPLGLIKMEDVFSKDSHLESPSRALIYSYSNSNNSSFDLEDTVYFQIKDSDGIQMACDVRNSNNGLDTAEVEDVYKILNQLQFNLHNADTHREGPQHTLRHIVGYVGTAFGEYRKIKTRTVGSEDIDTVIIKTIDIPTYWTDPYFIGVICYDCVDFDGDRIDESDEWEATPEHEHTH